ncbi:SDR family NAD(P)-dependent oxidoreductase [Anabaena cylindrica FACHB-243]|uniref:Phenolphthiocerol/phthiocerol polyketide synthase subunit E n=1 Tax=Anabaena cylindrica (strain ATCC 27899 / PCC 7122) TaxID=272123 RepID=K9ZQZ9_ANACC|nr:MULTISPECIES: type I polyketide synthase [Anabaena]AFZ60775.1 6-deoxyerythronolide-B synthase, Phenylalanine racemase (ATP-hydrolyzing) [Anabaena cylindrica PCC 7122]MBD2417075.1 SDR family NAD(P)-dependent oxidoreductase [Anabaena cylindrica FACHB-243]MBY5280771.1 SDR family NAD(P)-dependent oxidoreductase [Anabaena sp. CCAP 1446/1C]MBY5307047.1 SDR family NAD(P)-dependent oxidoreductase [Anabaena sp. CCAP 1446/1C]MCM2406775.1 SDR family NAD(P)-dependent oxidoreductase [Anabaena sp. CCAP 1
MQTSNSDDKFRDTDIAVIGMSCRFPGAKNVAQFWDNLVNGVESITQLSQESLVASGIPSSLFSKDNYVKSRPVLEDIELFDAAFFGYNPAEAELIDPQQRIFLETAWEALEDAGYVTENYQGLIGVYAGGIFNNYSLRKISKEDNIDDHEMGNLLLANDKDYLPTKVCYKLNLKGPGINIQTACSTSLVATHLACQSLLNYEIDIALAGAIAISLPHKAGYFYQEGGILSPNGHCRAFDAKAQGTLFGSGVGIVVLKRLEEALRDGDRIHAVIKGSAINNDGSLKVSYTAPSVEGQAEVIAEALANAGLNPETISYIEAHGTGTPMGDPIEIAALTKAFRASTQNKGYCAIGSVKTNVGHLNAAAGIAGLIKTILALKHKMIPPSLHFEQPNPQIDFANSPFYVNSKLSAWNTQDSPRRAGVSSFGVGGTNAHIVLEEAPEPAQSGKSRPWQLLVISAKTATAVDTATANLAKYLEQHQELNFADIAYTLSIGRQAFSDRRIVVSQNLDAAVKALKSQDSSTVFSQFQASQERPVIFMFPGPGTQYVNITKELYQVEPAFRQHIDICCELLQPDLGIDLRQVLYSEKPPEIALFAIEYALAQLWISWGIHPVGMIGYGMGEYVAAALAGVFSLKDALKLVANKEKIAEIHLQSPQIPYISNLTGTWITTQEATDPHYWLKHLGKVENFNAGLEELCQQPGQILLEVGIGNTLSTLANQHPTKSAQQVVLSSIGEDQSAVAFLLNTLGQLWLAGASVDWSGFYAHERRQRLPLPTYPFERQRYWIEPQTPISKVKKSDIADWFYLPLWKQSVISTQYQELAPQQSSYLVFLDECGLGWQLVERLQQQGHDVITVQVGTEFEKLSSYSLNPQSSDDYDALVQQLLLKQQLPHTIVHLCNVTLDPEVINEWQTTGFNSLLFLAQALGKHPLMGEYRLVVISNHLQSVVGDEILSPQKSTLLGPVQVIPQEYPNFNCCSIDIVLPVAGTWQYEKLLENLLTELRVASSEQLIAYRGVSRWVQTFEPVRLEKAKDETPRLRPGGVYLITGGLGGLGLVLAEYLAKTVQGKLILTGRSAFPQRDEWEQWLANHDQQNPITATIRKIQELETFGAEILVVNADVASLAQMKKAIACGQLQFGTINGVIHAAGVPGGGVMQIKSIEEAHKILSPKVTGTLVLENIFQDVQLDFLVLCSSIAAIKGIFGQVDYTAANSFLDAFARHKNSKNSTFTVAINWDAWQQVGMAAKASQQLVSTQTSAGLLPSEGIDAFVRILSSKLSQVVVSKNDLHQTEQQLINHQAENFLATLEQINLSQPAHPRPLLSSAYIAPRHEHEQTLINIWQEILGVSRIGINDNFFELGGDSLLAVRFISQVREKLRIELPINSLFAASTVADLAKYFERETVSAGMSRICLREEGEL